MTILKPTLILFTLLITSFSFAQTKEIAWKSHSGNMRHFNPNVDGDLGLFIPPDPLEKVQKINDTTFVEIYRNRMGDEYRDTVYNHQFWMKSTAELDTLAALYYPNIILVGFSPNDKNESPILKKATKQ